MFSNLLAIITIMAPRHAGVQRVDASYGALRVGGTRRYLRFQQRCCGRETRVRLAGYIERAAIERIAMLVQERKRGITVIMSAKSEECDLRLTGYDFGRRLRRAERAAKPLLQRTFR
jgi:hypothetical protein